MPYKDNEKNKKESITELGNDNTDEEHIMLHKNIIKLLPQDTLIQKSITTNIFENYSLD